MKHIQSIWMGTTDSTQYPKLRNNKTVDVAIVGGGIAGINAAYFLKKSGLKVAVIEAVHIVTGTSGHTTAKVTSQHDIKYSYLKKTFGRDNAQLYADSHQWAIQEFEKIIKDEEIKCDFQKLPACVYTTEQKNIEILKDEMNVTQSLGIPSTFIKSIKNLPFSIEGAICFENQATFHPRKFLLALAKTIDGNGSYIFENTRALDIKEGNPCEVITESGSIFAKHVIIATNFPFYDKGMFFARMSQVRSYAMAIKMESGTLDAMLIGIDEPQLSFKPHILGKEKWLVIGGYDHASGQDEYTEKYYERLEHQIRKLFKFKSIDYAWSAQDSSSADRVPYIGYMPQSKNVFVTTGYGEWGMTTSFVSAKLLLDLIINGDSPWKELYNPSRIKLLASSSEMMKIGMHSAKGLADRVIKDQGNIDDLEKNEGKVITRKGEKLAVYKDGSGKFKALSAICTHMGCVVGWNTAEKSWDCPCHGSRFTKDGTVIQGPAVKDLPKKELS